MLENNRMKSLSGLFLVMSILACSPEKAEERSSESERTSGTAGTGVSQLTVTGSLNISDQGTAPPAFLAGQKVALQSLEGEQLASGLTTAAGTFAINLGATNLRLTGSSQETSVFKLVGLIKADDKNKVRGVRRTLIVNPTGLQYENNIPVLNTGTNVAERIGAIRGTVQLEGGASPVGIDVYIPGTSYTAKTDDNGDFIIAFLAPGIYQIRIDMDGYGSFVVDDVLVRKDDTTVLATMSLRIAKGPQILSFQKTDGLNYTPTASLSLRMNVRGAIKYKVSEWPDFRNTVYETIDLFKDPFIFNYIISTDDGPKTIYVRVADKDGLEVESSLSVRLDTRNPYSPNFTIKAVDSLRDGYTSSQNIILMPVHCDDVVKVFITEDSAKRPAAGDFSQSCDTAAGISYTLSALEATKTLYLWSLDAIAQISDAPTTNQIVLDTTAPVLSGITPSGVYSQSVSIVPTLSERASIFYTIDGSVPTKDSTEMLGGLVLIGNTTIKLIAIDYAGNKSGVISNSYTIDSSPPILGSIVIENGAALTNKLTVNLSLSVIEGTFMMFSETPDFSGAAWTAYTTTSTYTFTSSANGGKKIYAKFKDDAGNELGRNGEIFDTITLDTITPDASLLTLYAPESPSGSFNKLLLWENLSGENSLIYEVEVATDGAFSDVIRSGTSTLTSWNVAPPFSSPGTYYWRVRATDDAGNNSSWVTSGEAKKFTIRLFATSYLPTVIHTSPLTGDRFYGNRVIDYLNVTDRIVLIANQQVNYGSCTDCSVVQLYNLDTDSIVHTFHESDNNFKDGYGLAMTKCDLNNDGKDEIVIGAPYKSFFKEVSEIQREFTNSGIVYVYDGDTYNRLFKYEIDPINAVYYCREYDSSGNCLVHGYQNSPWMEQGMGSDAGWDRQYTGKALACIRNSGAADSLAVSSPGYVNNASEMTGRVDILTYSGGTASVDASPFYGAVFTEQWGSYNFGQDLAFLNKYKVNGYDGKVLAIGASGVKVGSNDRSGEVYLYRPDTRALLATIAGDAAYQQFGANLFNLGNINAHEDAIGYEELAIRGQGLVRIYNGNNVGAEPEKMMAIKSSNGDSYDFARSVAMVGDLDGDGKPEIAVSNPSQQTSGNYGSGVINIYSYISVSASEASEPLALYRLAGNPRAQRFLGRDILAPRDTDNDGVTDFIIASAPGYNSQRGAILEFSAVSMAPTIPVDLTGKNTDDGFGTKVILAGDFDADGTSDFIIASPEANYIESRVGKIDIVSGADFSILKTIYGVHGGQRFGADVAYFNDTLFVSTYDGTVYSIGRTNALTLLQLNEKDHQGYYVHRRKLSLGYNKATKISGPGLPGEPYSPGMNWGKLLINSSADVGIVGGTRYGFAAVYDTYFGGNYGYGPYECSSGTDTGCHCLIVGPTSQDNSEFGFAATFVPDITGDNLMDIAVSAPAESADNDNTGKVYIFDGKLCKNRAILTIADSVFSYSARFDTEENRKSFGRSLAATAAINNSDNSVLIVSNNSPENTATTSVGELFAFTNSRKHARLVNNGTTFIAVASGTIGNAVTVVITNDGNPPPTNTTCSAAGNDVSFSIGSYDGGYLKGDVSSINTAIQNNAGCKDLISSISTPGDWSQVSEIISTPLTGGADGTVILYSHFTQPAGSLFGATIKPLDDVNADGYPEVAISMGKANGMVAEDSGQVIIYSGKKLLKQGLDAEELANYPSSAELVKFYSPTTKFSNFGASLFHADITGDGLSDFVIAAPAYSSSLKSNVGRVYIYPVEGLVPDSN